MFAAQQREAASRKPRDAAAAGGVGLERGDGPGIDHAAEVPGGVAVLAGGDLHAEGGALADLGETGEIVGGDGLFEPGDVLFGERVSELECLRDGVGAVGVDEEGDIGTDGFAGKSHTARVVGGVACRSSS